MLHTANKTLLHSNYETCYCTIIAHTMPWKPGSCGQTVPLTCSCMTVCCVKLSGNLCIDMWQGPPGPTIGWAATRTHATGGRSHGDPGPRQMAVAAPAMLWVGGVTMPIVTEPHSASMVHCSWCCGPQSNIRKPSCSWDSDVSYMSWVLLMDTYRARVHLTKFINYICTQKCKRLEFINCRASGGWVEPSYPSSPLLAQQGEWCCATHKHITHTLVL